MKEIGNILEVSESRVCQIHTKAILRLRGRLRHDREALAKVFADGSLGKEYAARKAGLADSCPRTEVGDAYSMASTA